VWAYPQPKGLWTYSGDTPEYPVKKEEFRMEERRISKEKIRVGLHLTEEESENPKHYLLFADCPVSEFMRRLCMGKPSQSKPLKEFWKLLNTLYEVHTAFKKCIPYYPVAAENCKEIEQLIVDLQKKFTIGKAV